MLCVDAGGEPLCLLPERAAWLPQRQTLLVADAHVGKAMSFRRWGVPVPAGTTSDTLGRLAALVQRHRAQHVVFLGDFLHSPRARAPGVLSALATWRAGLADLRLTLVRGNHDDRAGDPPAQLGFDVVDEPFTLGAFALCHHPRAREGAYVLAGHLHPCVGVGRGLDRLRLPCFWLGAQIGVLPAFGAFTGMHPARPAQGDHLYAIAGERVVRVA